MLTMSHINDRMGEWKMSYSFENKKIDEHIQTYTVYQVDKMPDLFLEVEFSYPRSQSWKTCIPIYEKFKNNELTELEYLDKKEEIQSQLQMYEMDFEGLMERFAEMKKAFSNENEWIKTFQRVELPEELKFEHVKKWVNKIIVSNFKEVHVYLTMQKWRDYFPEEWLEG